MTVINPGPYPTTSTVYENPTFFVGNVTVDVWKPGSPTSKNLKGPNPYPTNSGLFHSHNFFVGNVPIALADLGDGNDNALAPLISPGPYPTSSDVFSATTHKINNVNTAVTA